MSGNAVYAAGEQEGPSSSLTEEVIVLRRQLHPAYRIAQATQHSASTVSRILAGGRGGPKGGLTRRSDPI
jgi:hypothetical protein